MPGRPPCQRALAGFGVHGLVVTRGDPGVEQPVQLGDAAGRRPVARVAAGELHQELLAHGAQKFFDLPPALRPVRPAVHQLDAQYCAGAQQPRIDKSRAVVDVYRFGDAPGGQCRAQRGGQPDHVFVERPPGPHHRAAVVVDECEEVGLAASNSRAMQGVPGPQLVGAGCLEPAERLALPAGPSGQLQPDEQPLQRPVRRRPSRRGPQDPLHLRGGAGGVLPLQSGRQLQHLGRGAGAGLARGRDQRLEPAGQVSPLPPADALIRHPHQLPARPRMLHRGHQPVTPAPLGARQARPCQLLHQRVPEQRDLPRPLQPSPLIGLVLSCQCSGPSSAISPARAGAPRLPATASARQRQLVLAGRTVITGSSKLASVTAAATCHGDTASRAGHLSAAACSGGGDRDHRIAQRRPGRSAAPDRCSAHPPPG